MGISTVQSYRGAQIFEAIGISSAVIEEYFTGTPSRLEGIGLDEIAKEVAMRHEPAFAEQNIDLFSYESGSHYQWRNGGEQHMLNPETIVKLQQACKTGDYKLFKEFSKQLRGSAFANQNLRSMLTFTPQRASAGNQSLSAAQQIIPGRSSRISLKRITVRRRLSINLSRTRVNSVLQLKNS